MEIAEFQHGKGIKYFFILECKRIKYRFFLYFCKLF